MAKDSGGERLFGSRVAEMLHLRKRGRESAAVAAAQSQAMPIAAVSRTYLAGNRRFVHKSCMKQLIRKAVVGVAALFPLMGCDTTGNLIQDHEKMCKAHGKSWFTTQNSGGCMSRGPKIGRAHV